MNTQHLKLAALAATLAVFTAGCATYTGQTNDPNDPNRTRNGALIGAAIGAAAGLLSGDNAVEHRQRAMVGVGIGALAGGGIGAYQDRQEAELRRATAGTGVDVTRDGDVIKLNLPDGVTFDFAKYDIKPQFYPALNTIANTLREYNQTIVEVSGHTDSIGSDAANQTLSERRANSVSGDVILLGDFETPRGLPMTYLIGPDGKVAHQFLGPVDAGKIEQAIVAAGGKVG